MYLIHLLVAHTTRKSLLYNVHVIVCELMWPPKIVLLEMFNTLFGIWVDIFEVKIFESWKKKKIDLMEEKVFLKTFGIIDMHFIS